MNPGFSKQMKKIRIDVSQIPAADVRALSAAFLSAVQRFYSDPQNMKKFEEWKRRQSDKEKQIMEANENV